MLTLLEASCGCIAIGKDKDFFFRLLDCQWPQESHSPSPATYFPLQLSSTALSKLEQMVGRGVQFTRLIEILRPEIQKSIYQISKDN